MHSDRTHLTVSIDSPTDDTDWAALEALGVALAESLPVRAIVTLLHAAFYTGIWTPPARRQRWFESPVAGAKVDIGALDTWLYSKGIGIA